MKCLFCGEEIHEEIDSGGDQEALDEGLCRSCLDKAKEGIGFPELED